MTKREVKFGGTIIEVNGEVVAKVTSFNRTSSVNEEDITGYEDTIPGSFTLLQEFAAISVNATASLEGIAIESAAEGLDDGQSELRDAAEAGLDVTLRHTRNTGHGQVLTGFFTNYEETADTASVYKWSGDFRVNKKEDISPGS